MRHLKTGRKLSRRKEHRTAMLANLASSLIKHENIRTTDAKAKEVRPFVERMVTFARRGDLHARRIVLSRLKDPLAVKKLFDEIGPRYANRFGGYTRIIKLGFRAGDNSRISIIQFIEEEVGKKSVKKGKSRKAKAKPVKTRKKPPEAPEPAEPEALESVEEEKKETTEAVKERPEDEVVEAPAEEKEDVEAKSEEEADKAPAEEKEIESRESEKKDSAEEKSEENK